jgi:Uma2 family endonuclease
VSMPKYDPIYTIDQYLEIDRASDERYVYLDGKIYLMAGASGPHADIAVNLTGLFYSQLLHTPCRPRAKDTKVRSGEVPMSGRSTKGLFSYPDIVIICGEPEYHDAFKDVILNPSAIVEVLSPGTEAFDRGEKFTRLRKYNPTLTDYVLVCQDKPLIEHFRRQADDIWTSQIYEGLAAVVELPAIGYRLPLTEVYNRISFTESP